jgi:putative flippase GtrA
VTDLGEQTPQPAYLVALSRWPLLHRLASDRRVRYVFAGSVGAVVYYAIFTTGWLLFSRWIPYLAMAVIANFWTAVITFPLYRNGVFRSTTRWFPAFLRFYVSCFWALSFALIGLPLLVELAHLHVLLATAIIIILTPLVNYQIQRHWAFRERR